MDTGYLNPIPIHFFLEGIEYLCHVLYIIKDMTSYILLVFI